MNWFFDKGNINSAIEQLYGNISYFCNAKTLIKRATAGLVQRAVWRDGGRNSSEILFNFAATVARPSGSGNPPPRKAAATLHASRQQNFRAT